MKTRMLFVFTTVLFIVASSLAQGPPKVIVLNAGKASALPRAARRTSPLNSAALLTAVKSSTKASGAGTTDYLTLSAIQTYVAGKGEVRISGTVLPNADGGQILLFGSKDSATFFIAPIPEAKTYLIDISAYVQEGESVNVKAPDGSVVKTQFETPGDQHLLFMVSAQNALQSITITPTKLFTLYSCKVSILK